MADPDPSVSNGTCYFMARNFVLGVFIPCGNVAFGNIHCCQIGDHCLEEGACYNEEYGTTYLAGCTDQSYEDASCPDKKAYREYPWAGLIYCKFNRWVACEEEGAPSKITEGDECNCPSDDEPITVAFSAPSIIPGIGVLPTEIGGTIEWSSGHLPTTTQSESPTTTDSDSSTTITPPPSLIPTSPTESNQNNNNSTSSSLSTAAIAGIATGASIGAILLLGALSALWLVFRRRRNSSGNDKNKNQDNNTNNGTLPGAETGAVPGLPPHAGADKSPPLAEMSSPEVPQLAFSELSSGGSGGVGSWVARPELLGDVSPPVSPPLSPPGSGLGSGFATPVAGGWGVQSGGFGGHGGHGGQQGYYMAMSQGEHDQHGYYMPPQGGQGQPAYHLPQGEHGQQPYHMTQNEHGQQPYHMAQGNHGHQPSSIAQGEVQGCRPPTAEGSMTGQEGASELPA
ncbi:predicted protein [Chaetomium globosum CBS 148.51]|uniref:Uncharacterized protein n=1 Tax=Chaetomium globosum (strain ATCC 6205 / CBS 148.51 / DSM 1962 / NBRC 6347 / NRRL 1970) TaxID=306901 RepID=Q2GZV8_CHAGB|nr:uncharacterized protein CHGG_04938 [Chaetomium globosum CBS 148.51]EAQ88319.1 predicted protein [Chaetomium globosum CBS 148.51]